MNALSTLIIIKSSTDNGSRAREGLRLIAAMLGMDTIPILVFAEEGVRHLLRGAHNETGSEYLKTVADLAGINVLSGSLKGLGISMENLEPGLNVKVIEIDQLASMIVESKATVTF